MGNAYRVRDGHMDETLQHAGGQLVHNLDHGFIVILRANHMTLMRHLLNNVYATLTGLVLISIMSKINPLHVYAYLG